MTRKLNSVALSPMEAQLFEALAPGRKISTSDLVKRVYKKRRPANAAKSLLTIARSLQRKRKEVKSSKRGGPFPIKFWVQ